jgi:hypothetical protein
MNAMPRDRHSSERQRRSNPGRRVTKIASLRFAMAPKRREITSQYPPFLPVPTNLKLP